MTAPWRRFLMVSVGVFAASLDLFVVNIAMPDLARDFAQRDLSALSWVLNGYTIVYAALLVPAGRIADLFGRRRSFVVGLTLFTVASAVCAAAPSVPLLVAARLVQGAGAAIVTPSSLGLVLPGFPARSRSAVIAAWAAVGAVGAATGPVLGGALTELSWRWIFVINLPLGLLSASYVARRVPEHREPDGGRLPDLFGTALVMVGVAAVVLALVEGRSWGWGSVPQAACLAVAVVALGLAAHRSGRHPVPAVDLDMLRIPSFALVAAAATAFYAAFAAMLLAGVFLLTEVWGHSVLRAGAELSAGPLMAVVGAVTASRIAPRLGSGVVGAAGAVLVAAGIGGYLVFVGLVPDYPADFLPAQLVTGLGVGLALPAFVAIAVSAVPPTHFATAIGMSTAFRQVGAALGVAVFVAILGTPQPGAGLHAYRVGWVAMIGAALLAAVLLVATRFTDRARARTAAAVAGPGAADPAVVP